jgi:hypothetical protein
MHRQDPEMVDFAQAPGAMTCLGSSDQSKLESRRFDQSQLVL